LNEETNKQFSVQYLSAICASGKSYAVIQHINNDESNRYIYVAPTRLLANEISSKIPDSELVQSNDDFSVAKHLSMSLKQPVGSRVYVITHQALKIIGNLAHYDEELAKSFNQFFLIIDEAIEPFINGTLFLKNKASIDNITSRFDVTEGSGLMTVKDNQDDKDYLKIQMDATGAYTSDVRDMIFTGLNGGTLILSKDENGQNTKLIYLGFNPAFEVVKRAKSSILVCASADIQPAMLPLAALGANIKPVSNKLLPDESRRVHPNQQRITMYAAMDKRVGLTSLGKDKGKKFKEVCSAIGKKLEGKDFLYATNNNKPQGKFKSIADDHFSEWGGERIPYISSGLNIYSGLMDEDELAQMNIDANKIKKYSQGISNCVWLGIMMLSNDFKSALGYFCKDKGMDYDAMVNSIEDFANGEAAYQAVCRTTLRDFDGEEKVDLYFLNAQTMHYIKKRYLPDASIVYLDIAEPVRGKKLNTIYPVIQALKEQGKKQKEIADHLDVSIRTVKSNWKQAAY
jgi:hypothetical protein